MIARHYIVSGRVQGVGFRWFIQRQARTLGLGGWVRNRSDSTVELVAEGSSFDLERFESLLKTGPSGAYVREVLSESAVPGGLKGFDIVY